MSIENQVRKKQASIERAVREKQVFERKVREFLSIASSMTNQELEIALARLADRLQATQGDEEFRSKGAILNIYYQLRVAGLKKQSSLARAKRNIKMGVHIGGFSEILISELAGYRLPVISQSGGSAPSDAAFNDQIKMLAP